MIHIRKAKLKDINSILDLEKNLLDSAYEIMNKFTPENLIDFDLKEEYEKILLNYIKGRIFSKNDAIFIAEKDGTAVGHMIISKKKSYPIFKMEYYGRINTVFIKKEYRGKNISTKLKNEAVNWFKKKGINRVSLNVLQDNNEAIECYKKWGLNINLLEMRMTL